MLRPGVATLIDRLAEGNAFGEPVGCFSEGVRTGREHPEWTDAEVREDAETFFTGDLAAEDPREVATYLAGFELGRRDPDAETVGAAIVATFVLKLESVL